MIQDNRVCPICQRDFLYKKASSFKPKLEPTCSLKCSYILRSRHRTRPAQDRLFERVTKDPKTGCWKWTGNITNAGYGMIYLNGKKVSTHRLSYELANGIIPEGMVVCHKCDNPVCINPDHLFLGTQLENVHDMIKKGRQIFGRPPKKTKNFTMDQIRTIRAEFDSGVNTMQNLAVTYGVTRSCIQKIVKRKRWDHVV